MNVHDWLPTQTENRFEILTFEKVHLSFKRSGLVGLKYAWLAKVRKFDKDEL